MSTTNSVATLSNASVGGGWKLCRRVCAEDKAWHAASDACTGSEAYGTYVADPQASSSFSLRFSAIPWDEVMCSTVCVSFGSKLGGARTLLRPCWMDKRDARRW